MKENLINIKFQYVRENKTIQKVWFLRTKNEDLARKWYDKINQQIKNLENKSKKSTPASKNMTQSKAIGVQQKPKLTINTND